MTFQWTEDIKGLNNGYGGAEAAVRRYSLKQLFLTISQYSQENTCVGVAVLKSCRPSPATLFNRNSNTGDSMWTL